MNVLGRIGWVLLLVMVLALLSVVELVCAEPRP